METNLLSSGKIHQLLSSSFLHSGLPSEAINCCLIGDAFLQLEILKKSGHEMGQVLSKGSEFDRAVNRSLLVVAPLDSQALENGLFQNEQEELEFYRPAVDASRDPCASTNIVVARDFDRNWGTELCSEYLLSL